MEQMVNSHLKFKDIEFMGYKIKNFSKIYKISRIPDEYFTENHIQTMSLGDNRRLEEISFELYESTNYWDILMCLNKMQSPFELPISSDIIITRAEEQLEKWLEKAKLIPNIDTTNPDAIQKEKEKIVAIEEEKNEKYRNFKYISANSLSQLLKDIENLKN